MKLSCREIAQATGGTIICGDPETKAGGVSIDSRNIRPGNWFVPLKGEQADGHKFVSDAIKKGAAGSFVHQKINPADYPDGVIIQVDDTLDALQRTARYFRLKFSPEVIAITGSSGKTTTKDLISSVLGRHFNILKTEGNYNNHIGLPLTLFNLTPGHKIAVLEMAMRGPGEITELARIALPKWAVITNIGEAHIELLGSVEKIARAKGELLDNMGEEGVAVLNGDDPFLRDIGNRFSGKVYYYGWGKDVDFRVTGCENRDEDSRFTVLFPGGQEHTFSLPLPGRHNVSNALAALALGYLFNLEVPSMDFSLWNKNTTEGRSQYKQSVFGAKIIDDTYNANPDSMQAALEVLKDMQVSGSKIAVLGDMLELGGFSEKAHRETGIKVADCGIEYLITVGKWSEYIANEAEKRKVKVYSCDNNQQAWEYLKELPLSEGNCILLKGSRGIKLEEIVAKLTG